MPVLKPGAVTRATESQREPRIQELWDSWLMLTSSFLDVAGEALTALGHAPFQACLATSKFVSPIRYSSPAWFTMDVCVLYVFGGPQQTVSDWLGLHQRCFLQEILGHFDFGTCVYLFLGTFLLLLCQSHKHYLARMSRPFRSQGRASALLLLLGTGN